MIGEAEAVYAVVIGGGALIAFIAPIVKLNNNITRLTTTLEHILKDIKTQDNRINIHGKEIDELKEEHIKDINSLKLRQTRNENILDIHNYRITQVEEAIGKPYQYRLKESEEK